MKKNILLTCLGLVWTYALFSITTYTSPLSGSISVDDKAQWDAIAWTTSGAGTPYIYEIQPNYIIVIGTSNSAHTVDLSSYTGVKILVQGNLGFYKGNNNLKLDATASIEIAAGGGIGFNDGTGTGNCCNGTTPSNIDIGTTSMNGPFYYYGPATATQGSPFSNSTFWTGATSTDWNTATNWENSVLPSSTVNTVIPDNKPRYPVVTSNYSTKRLDVYSGATLTINNGASISVNDSLINNGTITVESDGALYQTTASYSSGSGSYVIKRTVPGPVSFVSSPVNSISVSGFGITPTGADGGQIVPKASCDPNEVDASSPYGILLEMHEDATVSQNCSQSLWFVKAAGTLTNGRGYSLRNAATTLTFTGSVNNQSVSYTALGRQATGSINNQDGSTTTTGWHLVGNPYPSPISLAAATLTGMGFGAQVQVYNNGAWVSYNPLVTVVLPVGQGFQIRKTAVGGSVNFTLNNSHRTVSAPATFRQSLQDYFLAMKLDNGTFQDSSMVYFYDGATDGYDPAFDANRLSDDMIRPMIYSVIENNELLSYNALPFLRPKEKKSVAVGIRTEAHGAHSVTFDNISTLLAKVFLEDLKLNTTTEISNGFKYEFTTESGDNRNRFVLHFEADSSSLQTSINAFNTSVSAALAPNPTSGNTNLNLSETHGFNKVSIINICGKELFSSTIADNETRKTLVTETLKIGIYFVKLSGNNTNLTLKLIKQ